jgi:hypothetical protein
MEPRNAIRIKKWSKVVMRDNEEDGGTGGH